MNQAKYKFITLLAVIAVFYTVFSLFYYLLNGQMDWKQYGFGLLQVGLSFLLGILFIFVSIASMNQRIFIHKKTSNFNEVNTENDILDTPQKPYIEQGIHPLEAEVISFIKNHPEYPLENGETLYNHSHLLWEKSKRVANATYLHRIICLAEHLSTIYAYEETYTKIPLWQFWKRAPRSFVKKGEEKGAVNAHIISQMPSFTLLSEKEQKALLIALTYQNTTLPNNAPEMAIHLAQFAKKLPS